MAAVQMWQKRLQGELCWPWLQPADMLGSPSVAKVRYPKSFALVHPRLPGMCQMTPVEDWPQDLACYSWQDCLGVPTSGAPGVTHAWLALWPTAAAVGGAQGWGGISVLDACKDGPTEQFGPYLLKSRYSCPSPAGMRTPQTAHDLLPFPSSSLYSFIISDIGQCVFHIHISSHSYFATKQLTNHGRLSFFPRYLFFFAMSLV